MERASKTIRLLNLPVDTMAVDELACAAWPEAVGRKIASHTRAAKLVRNRLVVEVEDAVWQKQLFTLSPLIVRSLVKILGPGLVEETEFRIVPRRREPQRAAEAVPGRLFADDADAIEDPVMRGIYRAARTRAGA
jgi:predicted nucleic acid-binding Zn ribbon protein